MFFIEKTIIVFDQVLAKQGACLGEAQILACISDFARKKSYIAADRLPEICVAEDKLTGICGVKDKLTGICLAEAMSCDQLSDLRMLPCGR